MIICMIKTMIICIGDNNDTRRLSYFQEKVYDVGKTRAIFPTYKKSVWRGMSEGALEAYKRLCLGWTTGLISK